MVDQGKTDHPEGSAVGDAQQGQVATNRPVTGVSRGIGIIRPAASGPGIYRECRPGGDIEQEATELVIGASGVGLHRPGDDGYGIGRYLDVV